MKAILITPVIGFMATLQVNQSPIDLADRSQRRLFIASVIFGVCAALVAAAIALLLWKANNRYQEAVKQDADARIAEARSSAAQADKQAGQANERAGKLELQAQKLAQQNLSLRGDVAKLEKAAADARAAQADAELRLTTLAEQQKRGESFRSQYLSPLFDALKGRPTGEVEILYSVDNYEAANFALTIEMLLTGAHWKVRRRLPIDATQILPRNLRLGDPKLPLIGQVGGGPKGISLVVRELGEDQAYQALVEALNKCGFYPDESADRKFESGLIRIVIGPKH